MVITRRAWIVIETHKADCMSVIIDTNMPARRPRDHKVERFFYASSACVYTACGGPLRRRLGAVNLCWPLSLSEPDRYREAAAAKCFGLAVCTGHTW